MRNKKISGPSRQELLMAKHNSLKEFLLSLPTVESTIVGNHQPNFTWNLHRPQKVEFMTIIPQYGEKKKILHLCLNVLSITPLKI